MRALLLSLASLLVPFAAAADAPADPKVLTQAVTEAKAQAKQTYNDAQQHTDLWTGLQLEAWAATQKVQLRGAPMLGASEVYGDPLFACPEEVKMTCDRGDAIEALTLKRYHVFANDGRPLSCSVPLGLRCDHGEFSFTRGWVAAFEFDFRDDAPPAWTARLVSTKGEGGFQSDFEEAGGWTYGPGDLKPADDGTALAVPFQREGNNESKISVVVGKKRVDYPGVFAPIGVASGGAWLLATINEDGWVPELITGTGDGDRVKLRAAAMGPGIGAIIGQDNGCYLLDRAGKRSPLVLPIALGNQPRLMSVGRWLVVASGAGARSLPVSDFLGVPIPDPPPQPESMALFRWDDLVADPKAPAVARFQNPLEVARHVAAGLYLWHGSEVDLLDLSGRQPSSRVLYTADANKEIGWAWARRFYTRVAFKNGGGAVIDDQAHELWSGDGDAEVWGRELGIVRNGRNNDSTFDLVRFAPEVKDRKTIHLDLGGPGGWDLTADPVRERWMARMGRSWICGDTNGTVIGRGSGKRNRNDPRVDFNQLDWPPIGRYYFRFGRLFLKATDEGGEAERLSPQDAWMMMGKMVFVLDREGHVLLTGNKKAGQWSDIGSIDGAWRFGFAGAKNDELVVMNWDPRVVGSFEKGPSLKPEFPPTRAATAPIDSAGPWRVTSDTQFVQPHGGAMDWSEDRAGFTGRLHSPKDSPYLLVITSSLVLALEPGAAKLVANPAKR